MAEIKNPLTVIQQQGDSGGEADDILEWPTGTIPVGTRVCGSFSPAVVYTFTGRISYGLKTINLTDETAVVLGFDSSQTKYLYGFVITTDSNGDLMYGTPTLLSTDGYGNSAYSRDCVAISETEALAVIKYSNAGVVLIRFSVDEAVVTVEQTNTITGLEPSSAGAIRMTRLPNERVALLRGPIAYEVQLDSLSLSGPSALIGGSQCGVGTLGADAFVVVASYSATGNSNMYATYAGAYSLGDFGEFVKIGGTGTLHVGQYGRYNLTSTDGYFGVGQVGDNAVAVFGQATSLSTPYPMTCTILSLQDGNLVSTAPTILNTYPHQGENYPDGMVAKLNGSVYCVNGTVSSSATSPRYAIVDFTNGGVKVLLIESTGAPTLGYKVLVSVGKNLLVVANRSSDMQIFKLNFGVSQTGASTLTTWNPWFGVVEEQDKIRIWGGGNT